MAEDEIEAHLGAVFDELVELIGETKQAVWTAASQERRRLLEDLKTFLAEQAVLIDAAELRLGARAPWVASPTAHHARNMAAEAAGDSERLVELLVRDFRIVIEDLRQQATAIDDEWQDLLSGLADNLERQVDAL